MWTVKLIMQPHNAKLAPAWSMCVVKMINFQRISNAQTTFMQILPLSYIAEILYMRMRSIYRIFAYRRIPQMMSPSNDAWWDIIIAHVATSQRQAKLDALLTTVDAPNFAHEFCGYIIFAWIPCSFMNLWQRVYQITLYRPAAHENFLGIFCNCLLFVLIACFSSLFITQGFLPHHSYTRYFWFTM
jgi:hypothetical protein